MRSHLRTPLIVDVDKTPQEYFKGLTRPAKKNYRTAMKRPYVFKQIPFDYEMVNNFMKMWSTQIGGGWQFGPQYFDLMNQREWCVFFAGLDGRQIAAILPMEKFDDLLYAQPVMYHKGVYPGVAKFMWYSMLTAACASPFIKNVDMGGGFNGAWDDFIRVRKKAPNFAYKWQFVAKAVKDNPDSQKPWYVQRCRCGWKKLVLDPMSCPNCGEIPWKPYG